MKKTLLTLAGVGLTTTLVFAQQQTVRGTIISAEDGQPVIGATVVVKGQTTIGVATNIDGQFTLNVPQNAKTLVISYVGFKTQEVPVGKNLKITLEPDTQLVDEVVVVAYGTTTKNAFTGSASKVSVEKLQNKAATNLTKALEGEIPGVRVFTTSGQPGASASVQIRGVGSVNSYTSPLYVVDGVPYGMSLSGIDQADIETMTVLKDASATALYGSRASNGVVLITTRRGKAGKIVVEADAKVGVNMRLIPLYETLATPEDYMEVAYESMKNRYNLFGLKTALDKSYNAANARFKSGFTKANAPTTPGELLFFSGVLANGSDAAHSINPRYNLWKAKSGELIDPATGKFNNNIERLYTPEDWSDHLFRTGKRYDGNVKVSGGTDKITFFSSLGYSKDVGYYIGSDFDRFNLRNNVSAQITKDLRATVNLAYARTKTNNPGQGTNANNGFQFVNEVPVIYPVFQYDETGKRVPDEKLLGQDAYDYGAYTGYSRPYAGTINPAGAVRLDRRETVNNQMSANINLEYRFLNDFKATVTYGTQYAASKGNQLTNPYYGDAVGKGRIYKRNSWYYDNTFTQILSWGRRFDKHNLDAFVAHESTENEEDILTVERSMLVDANSFDLNNAVVNDGSNSYRLGYAIESYFGQVRYDYDNKYFFSASLRRDGSSRFASDRRWGTFGSVGAAWLISQESFLKNAKWIDNLKLKASYGVLGNQNLNLMYSTYTPDYYLGYDLYEINNLNNLPSFAFYAKGNSALTWEKSATFNFGVEAELFKKLTLNAEFFHKQTTDMLFRKQTAPSVGYAYFPSNEGKLRNIGIELELAYRAIKTKNVDFSLRFNGAFYRNTLTEMASDPATGLPKVYENHRPFAYMQGRSVKDFYMPIYKGVDPKNGYPLWESYYITETVNGKTVDTPIKDLEEWKANPGNNVADLKTRNTSSYEEATSQYVGKTAIPDFVGGFGFDLRVHNFSLSGSFSFGLGGYGYDYVYAGLMNSASKIGSFNWHQDIRGAWKQEGDVTDVPVLASGSTAISENNSLSTRFLTSRSYLNLSNLRLSYDVPASLLKRMGLSRASIFVSGDNLFLLSARKGFVSMSSADGGSNVSRYLPLSTITTGLQLRF